MRGSEGEGGRSDMDCIEIETTAEALERSMTFHFVKEIIGYVLYMNQQIPAVLQDLTLEFDSLQSERKSLELALSQEEMKASSRRKHNGRMRELKQGVRKLEKLMNSISNIQTAMQLVLNEIPDIQGVIIVLGSNPVRPRHVYEMCFSHGKVTMELTNDFTKSKAAEMLSRKAIRSLISKGAESMPYASPTKLFLLVKAPSSFNLPAHFLPKRDFRYSRKVVPCRLCVKCKIKDQDMDASQHSPQTATPNKSPDSTENDLIWFQCRHTIKGLPSPTPQTEE
ncbi:uncharacterized protein LOC122090553 [Macadamia integrifolia]|uniref:uncharacterized protein LOC122090553 n=1 Tax=Macadamia integrifolia TaxID=60698 RepID=UPI001C4F28EC|nr:uncharacterized protein LOC122090553 [Macadamia integrifolia]